VPDGVPSVQGVRKTFTCKAEWAGKRVEAIPLRSRRRTVAAAESGYGSVCPCVRMSVPPAACCWTAMRTRR